MGHYGELIVFPQKLESLQIYSMDNRKLRDWLSTVMTCNKSNITLTESVSYL